MLGIDTNVLVRFLVRDDENQFQRARRLIRRQLDTQQPVFVSSAVLLETEWVLRSRYEFDKAEIHSVFSSLLDSTDVSFEDEATVEESMFLWKNYAADFSDCIIGAHNRRLGCNATATFDSKALKLPMFVTV